jgi:cell wall-associated NlpC family hydrolase
MAIKPVTLGVLGAGIIMAWSGVSNLSPVTVIKNLLSGKNPSANAGNNAAIDTTAYTSNAGSAVSASNINGPLGQAIANDALHYQGAGYVWGGAPAKGVGNWDCSSFANWVIGHDMGLAIPLYAAGKYSGSSHGPATGVWLVWTGAVTIDTKDAAPGDIAVWETHMGIVVSNTEMISALDPSSGTQVTTFANGAPLGEIMVIRRLKAVAGDNMSGKG